MKKNHTLMVLLTALIIAIGAFVFLRSNGGENIVKNNATHVDTQIGSPTTDQNIIEDNKVDDRSMGIITTGDNAAESTTPLSGNSNAADIRTQE